MYCRLNKSINATVAETAVMILAETDGNLQEYSLDEILSAFAWSGITSLGHLVETA